VGHHCTYASPESHDTDTNEPARQLRGDSGLVRHPRRNHPDNTAVGYRRHGLFIGCRDGRVSVVEAGAYIVTHPECQADRKIQIWVDADAMPRDAMASIDAVAAETGALVTTVSSVNHKHDRKHHITVDPSPQAADMAIFSHLDSSIRTVVVTQDYGLAALALGRGALVLSPRGVEFTNDNIDLFLFERDLHQRERQQHRRTKGPKPRTKEDAARFRTALHALLVRLAD
jgi:uncharacterized protein